MIDVNFIAPQQFDYLKDGLTAILDSLPPTLKSSVVASYNNDPGLSAKITADGGEVVFHRPYEL